MEVPETQLLNLKNVLSLITLWLQSLDPSTTNAFIEKAFLFKTIAFLPILIIIKLRLCNSNFPKTPLSSPKIFIKLLSKSLGVR